MAAGFLRELAGDRTEYGFVSAVDVTCSALNGYKRKNGEVRKGRKCDHWQPYVRTLYGLKC
jgi:hypothetical protein